MGSTLKGKNLLLGEQILSLRVNPKGMRGKIVNKIRKIFQF